VPLLATLLGELGIGRSGQPQEHRLERVRLRIEHAQRQLRRVGRALQLGGAFRGHVDDDLVAGMVNEIHPQAELLDAAPRIAEKIAGNSPTAVQSAKRASWGDDAVSTALEGGRPPPRAGRGEPSESGVEVRFTGSDHGRYVLRAVLDDTDTSDLAFVRSLPLDEAVDPAAEILIAYEMHGEPLNGDHGAPFRLVVPHWYAVASVKWLKHIDVLTGPFTGEFGPATTCTNGQTARPSASPSCACEPGSRIRPGERSSSRERRWCAARPGRVPGRS
jgi:hypothetical protein